MTSSGNGGFDSLIRGVAASPPLKLVSPLLRPGDMVADRFLVLELAGSGGMGAVYRATDRATGHAVALKIVGTQGQAELARFAQEARVLAELSHPAIVQYVAHGATGDEQPFLAMEWLEGEDLSHRLTRSGLTVQDSVALALRAAHGLAAAHARGVVHRDVKPSNLFLVGREPSRVKVLDFGVARLQLSGFAPTARPLTRTGALVGTVGYMSPEQATADKDVDARTDVFALGCVLFECLTGQPAFAAGHAVAVLAKVLREPAPRVRSLRPDLPESLDALVARMLSKERNGRPPDGSGLVRELLQFESLRGAVPQERPLEIGVSHGEQRLVSVLLALPPGAAAEDEAGPRAVAIELVRRTRGTPAWLANGALVVTWDTTTNDQTLNASRCAIALQRHFPEARIAVATGRAQSTGDGPPGSVIDQATSLLASSSSPGVVIDEVTAGLLGAAFDVSGEGRSRRLLGVRAGGAAARVLLGKETPCVGREKELALLEATLRECFEESVARAVLVTGPPGQGKSRIGDELVARARARGDVRIVTARGDPAGAGSAFVLARQLVRQMASLHEGDPPGQRRAQLVAHLSQRLGGAELTQVADFLGELVGAPPETASPALLAARNDARIMAEQLRRAFQRWLSAEATEPLLVVLEDLHWGDAPSVMYLGDVLRSAAGAPLMVLALARPEVHETFPRLWASAETQEIRLGPLTRRAIENLVRAVLGAAADADAVARIVERGAGNPFYIEELIRRTAEGRSDTLPETVLALAQSRLEGLDPDARLVLRAASVLGEVFWEGAVAALVRSLLAADVSAWLGVLVTKEVIAPGRGDRFSGETEYAFRHAILRDAAYAMLTEDDRRAGHRLAAEWLERAGERDALILADHYERAGDGPSTTSWLARASLAALDGGDIPRATKLAERGLAGGAVGEVRGTLRLVQLIAVAFAGQGTEWEPDVARQAMSEAVDLLPTGGARWFQAASVVAYAAGTTGETSTALRVVQEILALSADPAPTGPYGEAMNRIIEGLRAFEQHDVARELLRRFERVGATATAQDPVFAGYLRLCRVHELLLEENLLEARRNAQDAAELFKASGASVGYSLAAYTLAGAYLETGESALAEAAAREAIEAAGRAGATLLQVWASVTLGMAHIFERRPDEAKRVLTPLLETFDRISACALIAWAELDMGDIANAERHAREVVEAARHTHLFPLLPTLATVLLARIALDRQQVDEASQLLAECTARGQTPGFRLLSPSIASQFHLLRAETAYAHAEPAASHALIREARARILRIAATLEDPAQRSAFLAIDPNARTLARAREWLGGD